MSTDKGTEKTFSNTERITKREDSFEEFLMC